MLNTKTLVTNISFLCVHEVRVVDLDRILREILSNKFCSLFHISFVLVLHVYCIEGYIHMGLIFIQFRTS